MERNRKQSILACCVVLCLFVNLCACTAFSLCGHKPYLNSIFMPCGLSEFQLFHSTTSVISSSSFKRKEFTALLRKRRRRRKKTTKNVYIIKKNKLIDNNLHIILRFIAEEIRPIDVSRNFIFV